MQHAYIHMYVHMYCTGAIRFNSRNQMQHVLYVFLLFVEL